MKRNRDYCQSEIPVAHFTDFMAIHFITKQGECLKTFKSAKLLRGLSLMQDFLTWTEIAIFFLTHEKLQTLLQNNKQDCNVIGEYKKWVH